MNVHSLRCYVYIKYKEDLIKIYLLVSVPHPKEGNVVWTYVKYHIINEKEQYETIGLRGFD